MHLRKKSYDCPKKKLDASENATHSTNVTMSAPPYQRNAANELREAIKTLDPERSELVRKKIDNIRPGRPFDPNVIREINEIETKKNWLMIVRFASLIRKNLRDVQSIDHQIIELRPQSTPARL